LSLSYTRTLDLLLNSSTHSTVARTRHHCTWCTG
jgi:hypothetical protein